MGVEEGCGTTSSSSRFYQSDRLLLGTRRKKMGLKNREDKEKDKIR